MVNLINSPVSREMMEKYQNRHIRQVEHATKHWEARNNKVANNNHRRQWLERQNNVNYRNEYDRIRNDLTHSRIPFASVPKQKKREEHLKQLFSSGNV